MTSETHCSLYGEVKQTLWQCYHHYQKLNQSQSILLLP